MYSFMASWTWERAMRAPVYRNLDKTIEVMGFSPVELTCLCFVLIAGGEIMRIIGLDRTWAFLATTIVAAGLFWIRRSLGEHFLMRMIRFLSLPRRLQSKAFREEQR